MSEATELRDQVLRWYQAGETGVSSKAIAIAVTDGVQQDRWHNHPCDPSDLNRCLKFLRACPLARTQMHKVAALSEVWSRLVEHWDELEKLLIDEVGIDWSKGHGTAATKTYDRMQELGC